MTWHVLARHYMTWHLHHCIDLLIVWLHEDARPSSPGEQAKGGGGQVEKWTSVNFFWFVQEIFLYVSICAIEFRGCKSWPKRAPLSILFILILDTYLGPTSHKMRNWTWSWFRENLPCRVSCWSASWRMLGSDVSELSGNTWLLWLLKAAPLVV